MEVHELKGLELNDPITLRSSELINCLASFAPGQLVDLKVEDELVFTSVATQELQSVSISVNTDCPPRLPRQISSLFSLQRDELLVGSRICNAVGRAEHASQFIFWVLRVSSNQIRMIAGNGNRFVVFEEQTIKPFDSTENCNLFFRAKQAKAWMEALPVLFAYYGASEFVQEQVWHRDLSAKTRERSYMLFRLLNCESEVKGDQL